MRALVIGGDGRLGEALVAELTAAQWQVTATSRHKHDAFYLDLSFGIPVLPEADAVFIVAAMPKVFDCQGSAIAWRVNADAPIEIMRQVGGFVVFVSSDAVWRMGACDYARAKLHVEGAMLTSGAAVVRCGPIGDRYAAVARLMASVARDRVAGLHCWSAA